MVGFQLNLATNSKIDFTTLYIIYFKPLKF